MQLPTIEMPTELAQKKLEEYKNLRMVDLEEDEQIMKRSFVALAKGKKLFNLYEVMRRAGTNHLAQPRLAIARADWTVVYFSGTVTGAGRFHPKRSLWQEKHSVDCNSGVFPTEVDKWGVGQSVSIRSQVPIIPRQLSPTHAEKNYHILFEPNWNTIPGRDPILCKRISPNMFIILASWDLTDLELAVLEGTLE